MGKGKLLIGRTTLALGLATGLVAGEAAVTEPRPAMANTGEYPDWNKPCVAGDPADPNSSYGKTTGTGYWCNNYEWGDSPSQQNSSRGYGYRNCTDWVAFRIPQLVQKSVPLAWHNGKNWDNAASAAGYTVDSTPEPGDIAQWEGTYGHVAVVESVNSSGSVNISEYNGGQDGNYRTRSNVTGVDHFIDLNGTGKGINGEDLTDGSSTPPSSEPLPAIIQRPNGETDLVVVAPDQSLDFYFNAPGSSSWGRIDIPGSDGLSTPAVVQRSNGETNIAVQGTDKSLDFYFNPQGTNNWGKIEVAGPDSAHSAPAIIQRPNGETNIVVEGPNHSLDFYFNLPGSAAWGKITIPGAQAYSKPAIVQRSTGETNIAVQGPDDSLDFYFNAQGSPSWGKLPVAINNWAHSAPAMVQRPSGETDIVVEGPNHSLDMYINTQGSAGWARINVAGGGTTYSAENPPAVVQRTDGETNVVVEGPGDQADFYYNAQGSPNWGRLLVAIGGYSLRQPAMVQRSSMGETDLVIVGPGKRLDFYINNQGSPYWGTLPITSGEAIY